MSLKFAISDIHGCARTFQALLDRIQLSRNDELYLLGDYINRGPDSKGVIDMIWRLQREGYNVRCLRGNHEQILLDNLAANEPAGLLNDQTLESFGVTALPEIPAEYINWMSELDLYAETGEFLLVHAGLDFQAADPLRDPDGLLWIRDWYQNIDRDWLGERIVVHGHTPIEQSRILHHANHLAELPALDIDNGCVFGRSHWRRELGHLCAFELTNRHLFFQENGEKRV